MDWTNETYVRLYTRDTTNWRRLGWDGQCVLMALLRKVDRSGVLDVGEIEAWEGAMLHIGCPEDVAKRGMDALLRTGTATFCDGRIVFPSFIEAQECLKSDKQRAREYRNRRAAESNSVTPRDEAASQNVTLPSREITERHADERNVTERHSLYALLGSALPCLPLPTGGPPQTEAAPQPPVSAKKIARRESESQLALKAAVEANRAAFGLETKLTAGGRWWAAGASKVDSLVKSGSGLGEAAERVARAALQLTANGKGFAYALGDCVVMAPGRYQPPAKRPAGIAQPSTAEEMGDGDDITDLFGLKGKT